MASTLALFPVRNAHVLSFGHVHLLAMYMPVNKIVPEVYSSQWHGQIIVALEKTYSMIPLSTSEMHLAVKNIVERRRIAFSCQ